MKLLLVCCLAVGVVGVAWAAPQRKVSAKYDNVDVDRIIGNGRILTSYIKCAMDEGPCTAEGRELKRLLPDVIKTNCEGCTEQQKKNAEKITSHMRTARKRDWDRLLKKYDPTGEHLKRETAKAPVTSAAATPAAPAVAQAAPGQAKAAPAPSKTVPFAPTPAKTNPAPIPAKTSPVPAPAAPIAAAESAPVPVQAAPEKTELSEKSS